MSSPIIPLDHLGDLQERLREEVEDRRRELVQQFPPDHYGCFIVWSKPHSQPRGYWKDVSRQVIEQAGFPQFGVDYKRDEDGVLILDDEGNPSAFPVLCYDLPDVVQTPDVYDVSEVTEKSAG